ncbi:hypothetical protein ACS126_01210 [Sphingobacterium lactis]|uniref:hypothetical protein n=1 Tax=Sphingobacterium lactis TaxID=797291 RepID=UPI003EC912C8
MKNSILFFALLAASLTACNKDAINTPMGDVNAGLPSKPKFSIPVDADGIITKDFLSKDTIWMIPGVSFVKPGKTLTIEAGTYLVAGALKDYKDKDDNDKVHHIKGVLVVPKGAKIMAVGTASAPIVFTSDKAAGQRAPGDAGGVILMGEAPTNQPTTTVIEGLPKPLSTDITYGGTKPADNSGTLKYVRIEFAGYNLNENNEINGLTLGGVGSGTVLENIQVSWGKDDGFEFFGGTVNAKNLVALSNDDDDFDFDFGYTGTITNGLSLKDPSSTFSTSKGVTDSNGLESDNNGKGLDATPYTRPTLKNFTFLGYAEASLAKTNLKFGNRWRRKSSLNITNSIIAGYGTGAAFEDIGPNGNFSNNVVHAYTAAFAGTVPGTGNQESTTGTAAGYLNLAGGDDIFYTTASSLTFNPANLRPNAGSHAYGDGSTTYKGAFHPKQAPWTIGWTQFRPKSY